MKKKISNIEKNFSNLYNTTFGQIEFVKKFLFYLGMLGLLIISYINFSKILNVKYYIVNTIGIFSLSCLILKISLTKESLSTYLVFLFLISMSYFCDWNMGTNIQITSVMSAIIASRKLDLDKVFKFLFISNTVFIIFQVVIYIVCISNNFITVENFDFIYRDEQIRHAFFFYHPNSFSNFLFWDYMLYVYLNFNNKNKYPYIIIAAIVLSFVIFVYPNTRNASILFLLSIILLFIYNWKKLLNNEIFKYVNQFIFIICFTVSFLLIIFYNTDGILGQITGFISKLTSNRVFIGYAYLKQYGTSLFGTLMTAQRNMMALNVSKLVLDNSYYYFIIRCGIVITISFVVMILKSTFNYLKNNNNRVLYVLMLFFLYNCIENLIVMFPISFPFLFFGIFI